MTARGGKRERAGRPKGARNKITAEVKALAQTYAPAAIKELARLSTGAESEAARVAASKEILDRAYGRPMQGGGYEPVLQARWGVTVVTEPKL